MKNLWKLIGIIAVVAVMGLGMTACEEQENWTEVNVTTSGSLTITGLSDHNGKSIQATSGSHPITAAASATNNVETVSGETTGGNLTPGTISGGTVTLKVFSSAGNGGWQGYTGNNQNVQFGVYINGSNAGSVTVDFSDGKASVEFVQ